MLEGHQSHLEGAHLGQIWEMLNIKINDSNELNFFQQSGAL